MKTRTLLSLALGLSALALPLCAADWPQFRGPERTGISKETGLLKTWPKEGPPLVWTFSQSGLGYSGPAVVGDRLFLMGARDNVESLFALDLASAKGDSVKELWSVKIGPKFTWKGNTWNVGPSATPTVDGDRVYGLGGQGELVCVEAATGKEVWRKNLPKQLGAEVNDIGGGLEKFGWGFTWSPLVDGEQLICVPGGAQGTLAALNKKTGDVLWRSKDLTEQASYSSPIVVEVDGVRQYIQLTNAGVAGVAARDGALLWFYKREYKDVVIPTPIYHDHHVYVSVGFALGCDLIKLTKVGDKFKAEKVYANKVMVNGNGGAVLVDGYVYGYSEGKGWVCQDFKTGESAWLNRRKLQGGGSLIYADGHLYCYGEEKGEVALVEPNPKAWKEDGLFETPKKSSHNLSRGKLWTHPVLANGKLYLRDQELLFCYDVSGKK